MISTTIVITIDTRREKKDSTFPLILRLHHNRRTTSIPTGHNLKEKDWDETKKVVKNSYVGADTAVRLNNILQKKRSDAMDIILKLHEIGNLQTMDITSLKERIVQQNTSQSFFQFANQVVDDLKKANRIGTARSYSGVLSILKKYNNDKDASFQSINYSFLSKFEVSHKSNGNGANGLAVYMRTIRAIFNRAIKEGIIEKDVYPFDDYKIKTAPTEKRALDLELLKKIITKELPSTHICFNARNYFFASYMMYGMNFTDMAYLEKADIVDGRIIYRRKKTGKIYDIKISESLQQIISHYSSLRPESPYVFPIIKRETPIQQNEDILWARKRYNKKLKILAELCGIDRKLTSYVSRHSFATQAMLHHIPLNAISSMLGHSSLKTTEVYLKSLPSNILDDYNSSILSAI